MWKFLRQLYRNCNQHDIADMAAELAYYVVYSLFPFLFCLTALTAFLPVRGYVDGALSRLEPVMPPQAMALLEKHLQQLVEQPRPSLLTAGLIVTLWFASRAVDSVRIGLNRAYGVIESRPYWKTQLLAMAMTLSGAIALVVIVASLVVGGGAGFWLADHLGVGHQYAIVWSWARWPVTAVTMMLLAAALYYVLPDVRQRFRFIAAGSIVGTLVWLGATWVFSEYAAHFGSYNVMYGALGGVIVLMTWCYITSFVLLAGGELNAMVEHLSPEGKRPGARSADGASGA